MSQATSFRRVLVFVGSLGTCVTILSWNLQAKQFQDIQKVLGDQLRAVRAADNLVVEAARSVESVQQKAVEQAPAATKAALDAAQERVDAAQQEVKKAAIVESGQLKLLENELERFNGRMRGSASVYATLTVVMVLAGLLFSLAAAIASFLSWPKTAGVLSLIVAAIIGAPKALPFAERAAFYRILEAQSGSALTECRLRLSTTVDDYALSVHQLTVLNVYAGEKYPAGADIAGATSALMNDLKVAARDSKASLNSTRRDASVVAMR